MSSSKTSRLIWLCLAAALALAVIVYWPSLQGGYVFDDFNNIYFNTAIHLKSLDWESLRIAAFLGPPSAAHRPLAMLTFAIDWYFGSGDPLRMKVENLIIHLINGLLLFGLLRTLIRARRPASETAHADTLAMCVTAAWLLAPINFTAVAYVVQRMESLCQFFVLAGLWGYIAARVRMRDGKPGLMRAVASIVLGTVIGGLSKESAALLPLYALIVEWILFGFTRADGKIDRRLLAMYFVLLVLPGCAAVYWVLPQVLPATAWSERSFTLVERLLTEPRILWDYVQWSILPLPNQMALYHDSIRVSRGLLDPPSTILAILAWIAVFIAALRLRRTRPLVAIGIGWFFAAHLLTGTVIPLELAFEHRNYFASIGLYLALFSGVLPQVEAKLPILRNGVSVVLIVFFAAVTWVRALNWSNPLLFALSEAQANPHSPRAAYELARTYVNLSQFRANSPLLPNAFASLDRAATMPGADALPDYVMLELCARLHRDPPQGTWERIQEKLASQTLSSQNVAALYGLTACALNDICDFPHQKMVGGLEAALARAPTDTRVLTIYANYALKVMHDVDLATTLSRDAVRAAPYYMKMRFNLLAVLSTTGQREAAQTFYDQTLHDIPDAAQNKAFRALLDTPPVNPAPVSPAAK